MPNLNLPCLSCSSPQAADVKHAIGQGALDANTTDRLPDFRSCVAESERWGRRLHQPHQEVWQSINEWQLPDHAIANV
jgi:hypothetical protein